MEYSIIRQDGILHTIWKASAMSASEPTATPTPSSRTKNAASMASMTVILVDFDHAMAKRCLRCVWIMVYLLEKMGLK